MLRVRTVVGGLIVVAAFATARAAMGAAPAAAPLCLHTELLPVQEMEGVLPFRLVRELGRQAVLIAARDELGLATRDETLSEPFPATVTDAKYDLYVKVRFTIDGRIANPSTVKVKVTPANKVPAEELAPSTAGTPTCAAFEAYLPIAELTAVLEEKSRGEFVDSLGALGHEGAAQSASADNRPDDSLEALLCQADVVSQFAAVRAAHGAIAAKGQSREWLGALVRGYTNLALLTGHHWCSDSDVFAARALLYAERLVVLDQHDALSLAHRAYARAVLGLHADALADLAEINELKADSTESLPLPAWFELVKPLCVFDRVAIAESVKQQNSITPLATLLAFQQTRAFEDDRWMSDAARPAMSACREAYGIYAELAGSEWELGLNRMGAQMGPVAQARFLPKRIAATNSLPEAVRKVASGEAPAAPDPPTDPSTEDPFSIVPMHIADELVRATESGQDAGEPTWAALGKLIDEEVFVAAANYLAVADNAVESSQAEMVAGILPLVGDHRYADYVRGFAVNPYQDQPGFHALVGKMNLNDVRGNMYYMISRHWRVPDNDGAPRRGSLASWIAFYDRGFIYSEMLEALQKMRAAKWQYTPPEMLIALREDFVRVSPHSPQALRMSIEFTESPTDAEFAEWAERAYNDPVASLKLGQRQAANGNHKDAILSYERAIELSPTKDAFVGLAESYRAAGEEAMWQPTLERFFEVESLGLDHAKVHEMIARNFIEKDKWEEAKPHAEAAAGTWSAWGLKLAADVCEKLEQWDEAEKWFRELSTSYPTNSGSEWYFWCRRTGRGNPDDARKMAAQYFAGEWLKTSDLQRQTLLIFNLLTENPAAAKEDAKWLFDRYSSEDATSPNRVYHHMQMALVARQVKDAELEKESIASVRKTAIEMKDAEPQLATVVLLECQVLEGTQLTEEQRQVVDECLTSPAIGPTRRCNHLYFLGRALEFQSQPELAKKFYRKAIDYTYSNIGGATSAGARLIALGKEGKPE